MAEKKQKQKVCPNLPKGTRCPLCGMAWVCGRQELPKAVAKPKEPNHD